MVILFHFDLRLWQISVFIYYQWMFMSDISHYVLLWKKSLDEKNQLNVYLHVWYFEIKKKKFPISMKLCGERKAW